MRRRDEAAKTLADEARACQFRHRDRSPGPRSRSNTMLGLIMRPPAVKRVSGR
jgi:hypothetical protein